MRISDWSSDVCSSDLKLASLNRTRFAVEALHQLIGDFLGPPSAVRRHIIRNGNGRAADNLPVAVLVPKAWNDRVEPVPARFVGRIGKIIEQVSACDGRDRKAGRIDHSADRKRTRLKS